MSTWRSLKEPERALLELLLSERFQGVEAVKAQAFNPGTAVRLFEDNVSLQFDVPPECQSAVVTERIPVEATTGEEDGTAVHALLHVVGGRLYELEFYSDDGHEVIEVPPIGRWQIERYH